MGLSAASFDPPFPPPGFGSLAILDETGHTPVQWDKSNPEQIAKAHQTFDDYRSKGYSAYRVTDAGGRGEVLHQFDPTAERIILHKQFIGG